MRDRVKGDRADYTRSARGLKRARYRFAGLLREWCEEEQDVELYRERLKAIATAAKKHGLYAQCTYINDSMHSVMGIWARLSGMNPWRYRSLDERRRMACRNDREFSTWKYEQLRKSAG